MRIVIRTDASFEIGIGHVFRCITLANELRSRGHIVSFLTRTIDEKVLAKIRAGNYKVHILSAKNNTSQINPKLTGIHSHWLGVTQEIDAKECSAVLNKINPDWVVVDHYSINQIWHKIIRKYCSRILVIDDLNDRPFDCDLLLNQNVGTLSKDYSDLLPQECKLLLGPKYALLRKEFRDWRDYSLKQRTQTSYSNILITMGGADENNISLKILKELEGAGLSDRASVTLVLGALNPWESEIRSFAEYTSLQMELKVDVNNMAEIMSNSDITIGAPGSTSWERCCLGLPTVLLVLAQNQIKISQNLVDQKLAIVTNLISLREDLEGLLSSDAGRSELDLFSKTSSTVCDGKGVERLVKVMEKLK